MVARKSTRHPTTIVNRAAARSVKLCELGVPIAPSTYYEHASFSIVGHRLAQLSQTAVGGFLVGSCFCPDRRM